MTVITPSDVTIQIICEGGWNERYPEEGRRIRDRDWEIEKFLRERSWHPGLTPNMRERLAARWIDAVVGGGKTNAEAFELVRDKDSEDDMTGIELWDDADIPKDRWFRNAWVRSHNGGPIDIDLGLARAAHAERLLSLEIFIEKQVRRNRLAGRMPDRLDRAVGFLKDRRLAARLARAKSPAELKAVWPAGVGYDVI